MTIPGTYTINPSFCAIEPLWGIAETWHVFPVDRNGQQHAEVSGRIRVPAGTPMGFYDNSAEPYWAEKQDWFMPGKSAEERKKGWAWRNPWENYKRFKIGFCDQNYVVVGDAPVMATFWSDCPSFVNEREWKQTREGFKRSKIILPNGSTHRCISYCKGNLRTYFGPQWWGKWDVRFTF